MTRIRFPCPVDPDTQGFRAAGSAGPAGSQPPVGAPLWTAHSMALPAGTDKAWEFAAICADREPVHTIEPELAHDAGLAPGDSRGRPVLWGTPFKGSPGPARPDTFPCGGREFSPDVRISARKLGRWATGRAALPGCIPEPGEGGPRTESKGRYTAGWSEYSYWRTIPVPCSGSVS